MDEALENHGKGVKYEGHMGEQLGVETAEEESRC